MSEQPKNVNFEWDEFTDDARLSLAIANQYARESAFAEVNPEHILLAMLRRPEGGAAVVLRSTGRLEQFQKAFGGLVGGGGPGNNGGKLPLSLAAGEVLHRAVVEAQQLAHPKVGTEHLLLGLLALPSGLAVTQLSMLGLRLESTRVRVSKLALPSPLTGGKYLDEAGLNERRRALEDHQRRVEEERHVRELRQNIAGWQEANVIRSFVAALRAAASERRIIIDANTSLHAWVTRAEDRANNLDPIDRLLKSQ